MWIKVLYGVFVIVPTWFVLFVLCFFLVASVCGLVAGGPFLIVGVTAERKNSDNRISMPCYATAFSIVALFIIPSFGMAAIVASEVIAKMI